MKKTLGVFSLLMAALFAPSLIQAQISLEEAPDSIRNIMQEAQKGDATAQNEVGGWYYRGQHVAQNYDEAIQWWAKAAKQGNPQAIGNMGLCYQLGKGVPQDSLKASQLYLRSIKDGNKALFDQNVDLANQGNIFSCMLVAQCYQTGVGVKKDDSKAIPFLTMAADKNCVNAQLGLGVLYLNAKKPSQAAPLFKKGSANGNVVCTFYYGKMLIEGMGIKEDSAQGFNYMLRAADEGFPQAMYYMGNCYMKGLGVSENPEQAVYWYRLAAGKNIGGAQWELAQCLRQGTGTPVNYREALYRYAQAATHGYSRSFKNLADSLSGSPFIAYVKGMKDYISKDYEEALKEFKIVEKAKIAEGKIMEGAIMVDSDYPKHNIKKGIKILKDMAKENPQAKYILGCVYESGKGVEKDMNLATEYFTEAAEMNYGPAECSLGDLYYEGRGVAQSYEKAVEWYAKAYAQGELNETAAKRYSSCYENGLGGLSPDSQLAAEILKSDTETPLARLLQNFK